MRKTALSALFCLTLLAAASAAPPQSERKTLDRETGIQGYSCAKGYAWFFGDGRLDRCTVARDTVFGEAHAPAGSIVALLPDGKPDFVQMSRDTAVRGLDCMGGGWLGVAEASVVGFYPSGKLKLCFLAADQEVQGVPCAKGGFLASLNGADPGVHFYESGKLSACRLSREFDGLRRGDRFTQPQ
jgi:hypothetical protein